MWGGTSLRQKIFSYTTLESLNCLPQFGIPDPHLQEKCDTSESCPLFFFYSLCPISLSSGQDIHVVVTVLCGEKQRIRHETPHPEVASANPTQEQEGWGTERSWCHIKATMAKAGLWLGAFLQKQKIPLQAKSQSFQHQMSAFHQQKACAFARVRAPELCSKEVKGRKHGLMGGSFPLCRWVFGGWPSMERRYREALSQSVGKVFEGGLSPLGIFDYFIIA